MDAHGTEELAEWRERFEYRRMKMQRASEKQLYGKSYTEMILDKCVLLLDLFKYGYCVLFSYCLVLQII